MLNNNQTTANKNTNGVNNISSVAELEAAYAAASQALKLEATERYAEYCGKVKPILNRRAVEMADFRQDIAAKQAEIAKLEAAMAKFKHESLILSTQLEDDYHAYARTVCERKLELKLWYEEQRKRLGKG